MPDDIFIDIESIEDEEIQDIPQTGIHGFERPILYTTSEDPKEILNLNAGSLRVDDSANAVGNLLSGSRSVAKNLTGIAAYSFGAETSVVSNSLGGIASYANVGSFTTSVYDPIHPEHIGFGTYGTFGNALATNGNGSLIIIGNKNSIIDGYFVGIETTVGIATYYGSAYLYERISNNFIKRGCIVGQYSNPGTGATHGVGTASMSNDDYGHSAAMSLDGKTFAVGGPKIIGEPTEVGVATTAKVGVVWVYEYNAPTEPEFCGVGTLPTCCGIGTSTFCEVLESGLLEEPNSQVCGIGTTSICRSNNIKQLSKLQGEKDGDLFGYSLAISADAKSLIIGAPGASCTNIGHQGGVTYVYDRNDNSYEKVGILTGPSTGKFGSCVSVSAEGNIVVVGDSIGGKSYIFEKNDTKYGSFIKIGELTTGGTQVCVSDDGATIITANASSSTVYDRSGSIFTSVGSLSEGSVGISCSPDGKIITTASSTGYNVYNREGNVFYLNASGSLTNLDSFDMSTNTKVIYRGSSTEVVSTGITGKVYCDDQSFETFVYTDASGNVGVGTSAPTVRLDVNGSERISNNLYVSGITTSAFFVGDGSGLYNITSSSFSGGSIIAGYASTAGISTTSQGLTGSPNIIAGITTVGLGTTSSPSNSQLTFELISNTNLRIKVRGTDGVLRSANITLA